MLKEIRKFYEKIKLHDSSYDDQNELPITYIHVFRKKYPRLPVVKLPPYNNPDSQLDTLLEMRESTRLFSEHPISLMDLSRVLSSCKIVDKSREPEQRTYPSGGARFPVEIYLISYNVSDLDPGAYHYDIEQNHLEQLLKKDLTSVRRKLISPFLESPTATIIFTSVISRSEVKYGLRAYPYSLIEAGHMGQNIHLACAEIGLGSCSISGFLDDTINEILDLTKDEIPIYTISIGKRRAK